VAQVDYSAQHIGYVVRDGGISLSAWLAFAQAAANLAKEPPHTVVNPFTRQPMPWPHSNYYVLDNGSVVGLVVWEESECLGLAGDRTKLAGFISEVCNVLHARFVEPES
jgi:hypothetical protein